jgi:hypothetical protein
MSARNIADSDKVPTARAVDPASEQQRQQDSFFRPLGQLQGGDATPESAAQADLQNPAAWKKKGYRQGGALAYSPPAGARRPSAPSDFWDSSPRLQQRTPQPNRPSDMMPAAQMRAPRMPSSYPLSPADFGAPPGLGDQQEARPVHTHASSASPAPAVPKEDLTNPGTWSSARRRRINTLSPSQWITE